MDEPRLLEGAIHCGAHLLRLAGDLKQIIAGFTLVCLGQKAPFLSRHCFGVEAQICDSCWGHWWWAALVFKVATPQFDGPSRRLIGI